MGLGLLAFDFDGIVLESLDPKLEAMTREGAAFAERFAGELGARAQEAAERLVLYHHLHGGVSRVEKFRWLYREYLGREIRPDELEAHCTRFVDHALNGVLAAPLVPGVEDVLKAWQDRLPLVVCSGTPQAELEQVVTQRGLDVYFTALYGSPPGKAAILRQAVTQAGVSPEQTLMIGDSWTDFEAAQDVGTLFYGRGEIFAKTGQPWGPDLTGLNAWLESAHA